MVIIILLRLVDRKIEIKVCWIRIGVRLGRKIELFVFSLIDESGAYNESFEKRFVYKTSCFIIFLRYEGKSRKPHGSVVSRHSLV